jgi:thioesterase domain-containing protein/acyl carrier protein
MVPAAFVSLAVIPLNPNGKVDRRVLARMDVTIASGRKYVVPRSDTEKQLVAIWAEVLNLTPEKIGVNDNFFELGGHSLSTVQLMAKINRQFKQLLPLAVMFTASNIAALAQLISNKEATSIDILVPIQTKGNAPPIFGVPGAGGNVLSLQPLSRALGTEQPFYGLQAVGLDGRTLPLNSVEETAKANIAALKSLQPAGPYSLIGHSYGGVVAYEMARTLLEHGEEISSLILLDSMAPSVMQRKMANDEVTELFDVCTTIANLHGASVKIDLQRLQRSSGGENVQYIVDLLNDCGVEIDSEQFTAFYGVYRANLLCYRTYTPSMLPLKIDVWLYRATQGHQLGPTMPPDYGWNQLLQGPIRIQDVVANHFSILEKVHIQGLAGAFDLSAAFAASY